MAAVRVPFGGRPRLNARNHEKLRRLALEMASNAQPASSPIEASAVQTGTATMYLGIGMCVGALILIAIAGVVWQIMRKRRQHRRTIVDQRGQPETRAILDTTIREFPRPVSVARTGSLPLMHSKAGWGALSSEESVHVVRHNAAADKNNKSSMSFPKRFMQRSVPLGRLKYLSTVIESPKSRQPSSPYIAAQDAWTPNPHSQHPAFRQTQISTGCPTLEEDKELSTSTNSLKVDVLPSFAIGSSGRYSAAFANDEKPKARQSICVCAMLPDSATFGDGACTCGLPIHARSVSLGAPPSLPPSGPVPPLPMMTSVGASDDRNRQGLFVRRLSTDSQKSTGSSVLVKSPILMLHDAKNPVSSPGVGQLVAENDSAQLKSVANRLRHPLITGPRPSLNPANTAYRGRSTSMKSYLARYSIHDSTDSFSLHRVSSHGSGSATDGTRDRISISEVGTADGMSIVRVSSVNSLISNGSVKKVITPRRVRSIRVSANGSPAERRRAVALRDISGNAGTPSRQASCATRESGRSSNGNPFQWDQPSVKPSALKGSPNARKGHRRQNCVRISILTPQVLGPPPSRPSSPSIMHGIEEEHGEGGDLHNAFGRQFLANHRTSRPTGSCSLANKLRVQTLRASLTPSSPSLSAWTACQESGLASHPSDSQISISPAARSPSRYFDGSSASMVPRVPSPAKATVSWIQRHCPVPESYLSRPSAEERSDDNSSPFVTPLVSDADIPSSPPLPVSKKLEDNPAWPAIMIPVPEASAEYDPESPNWDLVEPEQSSPFLPFAQNSLDYSSDGEFSPLSRRVAYSGTPVSMFPPFSPKSVSADSFRLQDNKENTASSPWKSAPKLASSGASVMMASPPSLNFSRAPIFAPPMDTDKDIRSPAPAPRQRASSIASHHVQPLHQALPSPPSPSSEICMPPPLRSNSAPLGPHSEHGRSVLENAMALRRLNSEIDINPERESRRYVHFGHEGDPPLPFISSPDLGENNPDLLDFDFFPMHGGAESNERSALDDIDMSQLDKRLNGALAGLEAEEALLNPSPSSLYSLERLATIPSSSLSVWEDSEHFWNGLPQPKSAESSPTGAGSTLPVSMPGNVTPTTTGGMRMRRAEVNGTTPRSLYDSDGFLASER